MTTAADRYATAALLDAATARTAADQAYTAARLANPLPAAAALAAAQAAVAAEKAADLAQTFAYRAEVLAQKSPTSDRTDRAATLSLAAYRASVVAAAAYRRASHLARTDTAEFLDGSVENLFDLATQRRVFAAQFDAARYFGSFGLGTGYSQPIAL